MISYSDKACSFNNNSSRYSIASLWLTTSKCSFKVLPLIVMPFSKTTLVSESVKVLPSIAFELYVHSTINLSFNCLIILVEKGRQESIKTFLSSIVLKFTCWKKSWLSFLNLLSIGLTDLIGIYQVLPSLIAPSILPSEHKVLIRLSLIFRSSAKYEMCL